MAVDALERRVLAQRQAITSGEVQLEVRSATSERTLERRITIWFDGDQIRTDEHFPYAGDTRNPGSRPPSAQDTHYREVVSSGAEQLIWWSDVRFADGGGLAVHLADRRVANSNLYDQADPRLLGTYPCSFSALHHRRLDSLIRRGGRQSATVQADTLDGARVWRADYAHDDGLRWSMWADPAKDHCIVRIKSWRDDASGHSEAIIDCDLMRVEPRGIWFPRTCRYKQTLAHGLPDEDTVTVTGARFNEPIDAATFELAGIGIPVGKGVSWVRSDTARSGVYTWDGEQVVPYSVALNAGVGPQPAGGTLGRWLLIGNGILFALLAVWIAWRWRRGTTTPRKV